MPAHQVAHAPPAGPDGGRLRLDVRDLRPERAPPEGDQQRRHQRQPDGHHHDDAEREDRPHLAGRVEVREAEHEHRRDHDPAGREDRRRRAQRGARHRRVDVAVAAQLVPEAADDQQAVVGARAEHQHDQDRRRLAADGGRARLHQAVDRARRDHVRDRHHREHQRRDQRRAVGQQHQDEDEHHRDRQQRPVDPLDRGAAVGVEARRPGHEAADRVRGRLRRELADRGDVARDRLRVVLAWR